MNLMIDLETLGTRPGCCILSIAAVPFLSPYDIEPFYEKISKESCRDAGLSIEQATLEWWSKQSILAREEAFSGTKTIIAVLSEFYTYCKALPTAITVWGNGSDFDIAILAETYKQLGMSIPWKYTNARCYRTLKSLCPQIPYIPPNVKHNALEDAKAQASHATRIFKWMMKEVPE